MKFLYLHRNFHYHANWWWLYTPYKLSTHSNSLHMLLNTRTTTIMLFGMRRSFVIIILCSNTLSVQELILLLVDSVHLFQTLLSCSMFWFIGHKVIAGGSQPNPSAAGAPGQGTCNRPGCNFPKRIEGTRVHDYCSRTCANTDQTSKQGFHQYKLASAQAGI